MPVTSTGTSALNEGSDNHSSSSGSSGRYERVNDLMAVSVAPRIMKTLHECAGNHLDDKFVHHASGSFDRIFGSILFHIVAPCITLGPVWNGLDWHSAFSEHVTVRDRSQRQKNARGFTMKPVRVPKYPIIQASYHDGDDFAHFASRIRKFTLRVFIIENDTSLSTFISQFRFRVALSFVVSM